MDPHSFSKLGPDPDPHSLKKLDPGPDRYKVNADPKHFLELESHIRNVFGKIIFKILVLLSL
jgi:hypothetical protein